MAIHSADLQAQKQVQTTQKDVFERLFEEAEKANQSFRSEVLEKFCEVPIEFTHVWKIQPYTHLRDATAASSTKRLSSGKIYTGTPGYCIEFLVDLNGAVAGSTATHVGAMFKIHSGEYDDLMPWPFYSRIVLTLKNHLYPDKNVQFQIVPRDSSPELLECFARPQPGLSSKVFGISKVISTPLLENESKGFLLGNCVVLTFAIHPDLEL
uniref:Putative tumor necrosis factor receptor n=1 Tax=Ixodes ricinus TaxID=34613 RepID=V5HQ42_IXORI